MTASRPPSLELLDELRKPGSALRRELCVAVATISSKIANEQQRALAQVRQRDVCVSLLSVMRGDRPWVLSMLRLALQCHCLLYTSPSPRDRQKSRMPSSA